MHGSILLRTPLWWSRVTSANHVMNPQPSVLIADDHPLARDSLHQIIIRTLPDALIAEAATADEVRTRLSRNPSINLLLLDLMMPGTSRFELLEQTCEAYPELKILVLSASESPYHKRKSLDLGASGYVTKTEPPDEIVNAIRVVVAGGIYLPEEFLDTGISPGENNRTAGTNASLSMPVTPRQAEVLSLAGQGKSNKAIARDLNLTENTVKIHMAAILRAFDAKNRTEAVMAARRLGLIED